MTMEAKTVRRHEIDALRVIATLLLIVFHTGMVFTAFDLFHIQNAERSEVVGEINNFINQWHMPLFFLLAGMSAWYALGRRDARTFRKERLQRLFVPLLVGMAVIIPPQVYVERIADFVTTRKSPINFTGNFFEWYPNTIKCCYPEANLSWHHLWFLMYLFVYSVLLVGLFKWLRGAGEDKRNTITEFLAKSWNLLLIPAIYFGSAEFLLRSSFPNNQDLVTDLANHANYPVVFTLGYLLVSDQRLDSTIARTWKWALGAGIAVILLPDIATRIDHATRGISEWLVLIGLIGLGRQVFTRSRGWISRFSAISLPFYIWHQTVIVVTAYFVIQWDMGVFPKFVTIATFSFFVTWGLAEATKLTRITRTAFGLRP